MCWMHVTPPLPGSGSNLSHVSLTRGLWAKAPGIRSLNSNPDTAPGLRELRQVAALRPGLPCMK